MDTFITVLLVSTTVFLIALTILVAFNKDKIRIIGRVNAFTSTSKEEAEQTKRIVANRHRGDTKSKILITLANEISMSGLLIKPSEFLMVWTLGALVPSSLLLALTSNFIVTLGALVIGVLLPPFYIHMKKVKRVELFEQQLVDAIAIICNSLKAGLTFQQALYSISNEMPEPISKEFGRVVRELKLGSTIEKSLTNLSEKINSKNFMLIVSAILIQRQTGGNLSDILSNIAGTIKERFKIKNEIKVLTTTGRTSGMVVGFMPVAILLFFMLINPDYVMVFFKTSIGIGFLVAAAVLETIGFLVIRKIVNIKF